MRFVEHVKGFWRFHCLILGSFLISVVTLGCAVQEPAFYEGTWVVTEARQSGNPAYFANDTASYLGRSVTYSKDYAKLDQISCHTPNYTAHDINVDDFVHQFNTSPISLGFSDDSITEVMLSCSGSNARLGTTLLYQENTYTYTLIDDVFLKLEKTL